jgi:hypothetical protein
MSSKNYVHTTFFKRTREGVARVSKALRVDRDIEFDCSIARHSEHRRRRVLDGGSRFWIALLAPNQPIDLITRSAKLRRYSPAVFFLNGSIYWK